MDRHIDRQTDNARYKDGQTSRQTNMRYKDGQTDRQTNNARYKDGQTGRQTDRQVDNVGYKDRQTGRQTVSITQTKEESINSLRDTIDDSKATCLTVLKNTAIREAIRLTLFSFFALAERSSHSWLSSWTYLEVIALLCAKSNAKMYDSDRLCKIESIQYDEIGL